MQLRKLGRLAEAICALIAFDMALQIGMSVAHQLYPDTLWGVPEDWETTVMSAYMAYILLIVVTFSAWIIAAGKNLIAADFGDRLKFTPGSRVGWFFVPIANLWKPYQGMRELWNASHDDPGDDTNPPLVTYWWALWLLGIPLAIVDTLLFEILSLVVAVASSGAAILMVQEITRAQRKLLPDELHDIFA